MTRTLTPDRSRAAIALAAIVVVTIAAGSFGQIAAIVLGAVAGLGLCRGEAKANSGQLRFPVSRRGGAAALVLFAALFVIPLIVGVGNQAVALFEAFYRSGALVFGGGHVVLPLLQAEVVTPRWVTNETFLAGYGLTQAMPGPLFTFAAYLGAVMQPTPNGVAGSAIAIVQFPPRSLARLRDAAFLGRVAHRTNHASRHAGRERCRGWDSRTGSLQSDLDERGSHTERLRICARRIPPVDGLEDSAVDCRCIAGRWRYPARSGALFLIELHRPRLRQCAPPDQAARFSRRESQR